MKILLVISLYIALIQCFEQREEDLEYDISRSLSHKVQFPSEKIELRDFEKESGLQQDNHSFNSYLSEYNELFNLDGYSMDSEEKIPSVWDPEIFSDKVKGIPLEPFTIETDALTIPQSPALPSGSTTRKKRKYTRKPRGEPQKKDKKDPKPTQKKDKKDPKPTQKKDKKDPKPTQKKDKKDKKAAPKIIPSEPITLSSSPSSLSDFSINTSSSITPLPIHSAFSYVNQLIKMMQSFSFLNSIPCSNNIPIRPLSIPSLHKRGSSTSSTTAAIKEQRMISQSEEKLNISNVLHRFMRDAGQVLNENVITRLTELTLLTNNNLSLAFVLHEIKKDQKIFHLLETYKKISDFSIRSELINYYDKLLGIYDSLTNDNLKINLWRGILESKFKLDGSEIMTVQMLKSVLGYPMMASPEFFGNQRKKLKTLFLYPKIELADDNLVTKTLLKILEYMGGDYHQNCYFFGEKFANASNIDKIVFLEPVIEKMWNEQGLPEQYFEIALYLMQQKEFLVLKFNSILPEHLRDYFSSSLPIEHKSFFQNNAFNEMNKIQLMFIYKGFCSDRIIGWNLINSVGTLYLNRSAETEDPLQIPNLEVKETLLWHGLAHRVLNALVDSAIYFDDFYTYISLISFGEKDVIENVLTLYRSLITKIPEDMAYHQALVSIYQSKQQLKTLKAF